jgi:hypothetical protein
MHIAVSTQNQEIAMISHKIVKAAAAFGLTLLAAGLATAQSSTPSAGSTDIYNTDFQKSFATGDRAAPPPTGAVSGTTDIYATDFQKVFASDPSTKRTATMASGSIDIYSTDFQKLFM